MSTKKSLPAPSCLESRRTSGDIDLVSHPAPGRRALRPVEDPPQRLGGILARGEPRDPRVAPEPRPLPAGEGSASAGRPRSTAPGRGSPPRPGASTAPCSRAPGGRSGQPPAARPGLRTSSSRPGVHPGSEALVDPAVDRDRVEGHAEHRRSGSAGRPRARGRRRRTADPTRASPRAPARPAAGCSASCGRPPPGRGRRSRSCRRARPPAAPRLGLERGSHLGPAAREREVVDHRPHVEPGAADQQRPARPSGDVAPGRRPRPRLELRDRELLDGVDQVEQVVAAPRRAPAAGAWPWPCPSSPGRRSSSRRTRSRRRPAGAPPPARRSTCPTRWCRPGRPAPAAGVALRCRVLSRRRPGSGCGVAVGATQPDAGAGQVVRGGAGDARRSASAPAADSRLGSAGTKCTILPCRVRPASTEGSRRLGPSTSTSSLAPDPRPVVGQRRALDDHPQALEALGHHLVGHEVVLHGRGPGARARREDEGVGAVVLGLGHDLQRRLEVVVGLTGEARR